jgi:hypothetical protein
MTMTVTNKKDVVLCQMCTGKSKLEACHHVWSNRPATELMVLKK